MGSISEKTTPVNLLQYLKSVTEVDADCLDIEVSATIGPFADLTSNQSDCYFELIKPQHAALLKKAAALGRKLQPSYPTQTAEELGYDIAMLDLSMSIMPKLTGNMHVMANPIHSYSYSKMIENGKRLRSLCQYLDPNFDLSRLIMKVPCTWEGLQACRTLSELGIKTLGTTLYTMEQVVLAGEAGCISVAPFVHNINVHYDPEFVDKEPIFDLCVEAQNFYQKYSFSTHVKACSLLTVDHVMRLAGIAALTLPGNLLQELAKTEEPEDKVRARSLFFANTKTIEPTERLSYINDEEKFRKDLATADKGSGQVKLEQTIKIFSDAQKDGEKLIKSQDLTVS